MVLDLAAGELYGLYDLMGRDKPNLQLVQFVWLSDERLHLSETWMAEVDRHYLSENIEAPGCFAYAQAARRTRCRVIDWVARATVFERDHNSQQVAYATIAPYGGDLLIVSPQPPDPEWHWWVYDPVRQELVKPLVPRLRKGDWIPSAPDGPWAIKWLLPDPVPANSYYYKPYDIEFINHETGEARRLSQVRMELLNGLFITADGRYVITSFYSQAEHRWAPVVFDTLTGQRHELPRESWQPEALSHSRGVLLARVMNRLPDESWTEVFVEIPLSRLLPQ